MSASVQDQGVVARLKNFFGLMPDGSQSSLSGYRIGSRGEQYVLSPVPTKALLAQEGSYFTANNNQTGIATAASPNAFSATNPFILLTNGATANTIVVPDYIALVATAAGTAGSNVQFAITKDVGSRYTSGGTALTVAKPNSAGLPSVVTTLWAGNITAAAASASVTVTTGLRYLTGAIPVIGDTYWVQFGSVDGAIAQGKQTINVSSQGVAPIVVNPGETFLFHLWLGAQTAASSYAVEMGWWEW